MTGAGSTAARLPALLRSSWRFSPLAAASAVSLANSFVIAVVYARVGGPSSYGTFQLAFSIAGVVGVLALAGSATAATRAAAQGRLAAWDLFRARVPFAAATGAALVVAGVVLVGLDRVALGAAIAVVGAFVPLHLGADTYPAQLVGLRRFRAYFGFQALVQGATAAAVVAAVVVAPHRPWLAALALAGLTGLLQVAALARSRPRTPQASPSDRTFARHLSGLAVLTALDAQLDVVVTGALLGTRDAGIVAVGRMLPIIPRRLWEIAYQPFFVRMAGDVTRSHEVVRRYRFPLLGAFAAIAAVGIALAPFAIPRVFGHSFRDAVLLAQLLLAANAVRVFGYLDEIRIKATGDVRRLSVIYIVLPVLSLVALPPLVWVLGVNGVAVEALLASATYAVLTPILARRVRAPEAA